MRIIIAAVCALPFAVAVAAEDFPMPRMLKGMDKGQWKNLDYKLPLQIGRHLTRLEISFPLQG